MNTSNQENSKDWNTLLKRTKQGDQEAPAQLCSKLTVRLRLILRYKLWGWDVCDHEDIVQDVLLIFMKKINRVHSNPHPYAFKILNHRVGLALRQKRRGAPSQREDNPEDGSLYLPDYSSPELCSEPQAADFLSELEIRDQIECIYKGILQLSPFCRTFFLGVLESHSIQEMWTAFQRREPELRRSSFDKRIFDCRKKLKQVLQDRTGKNE